MMRKIACLGLIILLWMFIYWSPYLSLERAAFWDATTIAIIRGIITASVSVILGVFAGGTVADFGGRKGRLIAIALILPGLTGSVFGGVGLDTFINYTGLAVSLAERPTFYTQLLIGTHFTLQWFPTVTGIIALSLLDLHRPLWDFLRTTVPSRVERIREGLIPNLGNLIVALSGLIFILSFFDGERARLAFRGSVGTGLADPSQVLWSAHGQLRSIPGQSWLEVVPTGLFLALAVIVTAIFLGLMLKNIIFQILAWVSHQAFHSSVVTLAIASWIIVIGSPFISGISGSLIRQQVRFTTLAIGLAVTILAAAVLAVASIFSAMLIRITVHRHSWAADRIMIGLVLIALTFLAFPPAILRIFALNVRFGLVGEAGAILGWLAGHALHIGFLLIVFSYFATAVLGCEIHDFIQSHRLNKRESLRVYLRTLLGPSILVFVFALSLLMVDQAINFLIAGRLPLIPILLYRAFEGRYGGGALVVRGLATTTLVICSIALAGIAITTAKVGECHGE